MTVGRSGRRGNTGGRPRNLVDDARIPEEFTIVSHGRREHMSDIIQAIAGLLSHQQTATMSSGART
ncbi:hypothetical protein [Streptomyces purpurascens]|uniref:hypothetical protein n=1 Tax=Streptomyces purpurascens TaxID=1924 RepID=UPI0019BC1B90|nr:hypothetical protein [Streptomyces purpurascens]MCE7052279.1 hypothetical protein [Streptomyces purpurascens]GHA55651.1 hypothetical protein GCM10010303_79360 [Streptomyces purpurascens]